MRHTALPTTIARIPAVSSTTSACEVALAGQTRAFASPTVSPIVRMAPLGHARTSCAEAAIAGLPRLVVRP